MTFISGRIKFPAFKATIKINVPYRVRRVSCFYFFFSDSPDEYTRYYKVVCFAIVKKMTYNCLIGCENEIMKKETLPF